MHMTDTPPGTEFVDNRYVIARLGSSFVGIPVHLVVEMHKLGQTTPLPNSPPWTRGVLDLRGRVVYVYDLRICLGMRSQAQELQTMDTMLKQREQDHHNWLRELEQSVRENRPFGLTTDPHACAFGRWYDTYKAPNIMLENHMSKFDEPHKLIHAIATRVKGLVADGKAERALELIESTRDEELSQMIELFAQLRDLLHTSSREIAVILRRPSGGLMAYSIDQVDAVDELNQIENPNLGRADSLGYPTAFYGPEDKVVILLTAEQLYHPESFLHGPNWRQAFQQATAC
jgi:purine-binding chemotaxis protein CheW